METMPVATRPRGRSRAPSDRARTPTVPTSPRTRAETTGNLSAQAAKARTTWVTNSTISRRTGRRLCARAMNASPIADFRAIRAPPRLSSIISAMRRAAPSAFSASSVSRDSSSVFFAIAIAEGAATRRKMSKAPATSSPASFRSDMVFVRLIVPSRFLVMVTPRRSSALWPLLVGASRAAMTPRSPVPARDAWMPAFPRTPIAAAVSSREIPAAAEIGATKDMASPSCWTLVFDFAAVVARTSAIRPTSPAVSPKPLITFEAMSAAVARSRAPAAARFSEGPMASTTSVAVKPACPRKRMPSAASCAENLVVAPRSLARFSISWNCSLVVCTTAWTALIDRSNSAAALIGRNATAVSPAPRAARPTPADVAAEAARLIPWSDPSARLAAFASRSIPAIPVCAACWVF